ncbi:MAG: energy transducer TonB [Sphingobium sp.]
MTAGALPHAAAADPFGDAGESRRWGMALAGVVGVHLIAIAIAAQWRTETPPIQEEAAIAVELAPLPVADHLASSAPAAAATPAQTPPTAQPRQAMDVPRPVDRAEVPLPPVPVTPVARPAVQATPSPVPSPAPAPTNAATTAAAAGASGAAGSGRSGHATAEAGAGSNRSGRGRPGGGDVAAVWRGRVLAHLDRHKRYPAAARIMKRQGRVHVSMTMDRHGKVLSVSVTRSDGFKPFDTEAIATIRRAEPLPEPPAELAGNVIPLQLPIAFGPG